MWKFSHWIFSLVAASQRLIDRRLTRAGMLVGSVLIGTAALGVDTNLTVAYRIFAFTASLIFVGWIATLLQRGHYAVERHLPRVVTAGEPFSYRVTVSNLANAPRDGLALIDDLADPRPPLHEFRARIKFPTYRAWRRLINERKACRVDELALPELAPRGALDVTVRGEALRRGNQHFQGMTVARADPLGLVRALSQMDAPANVLVLPRRYALPPITLPGSRRYQPGGVSLAASIGNSEEFVGLRDYRPGDPLQRIHWKSYARAGEPVVREYQDEYFERHALILDTFSGTEHAAAFEEAVSIASSLACTVNTQECLLDLMFVGAESYIYTAGRGQMTTGNLLEVLAGVQLCASKPFSTLQNAVTARRGLLTGSICILLAWDDARREFIRMLRTMGVPVLALVVTSEPVEEREPWLRVITPGKVQEGLAGL
ncbi:MAG: DUF58 domain-containing protein [Burkholderiales bacterium]